MSKVDNRLEIGGSGFELIEFTINRILDSGEEIVGHYGVNVAKVREVVRMPTINPLASTVKGILGLFELRGVPIPAIDLATALGDTERCHGTHQQIIVTEFSNKRAGFVVGSTQRIRRIAWEKVLPPTADKKASISGMTLIENNQFLFILDLEKILIDIETLSENKLPANTFANQNDFTPPLAHKRVMENDCSEGSLLSVLLVDDSPLIVSNASEYLIREGYQVTTASNGVQAQNLLKKQVEEKTTSFDVIVTDVEMPQMDGLSLTTWVKSHDELKNIPVIINTSLSGDTNVNAGLNVGASAYVVKNDVVALVAELKKFHKATDSQ